jgi:hypothetical protein
LKRNESALPEVCKIRNNHGHQDKSYPKLKEEVRRLVLISTPVPFIGSK